MVENPLRNTLVSSSSIPDSNLCFVCNEYKLSTFLLLSVNVEYLSHPYTSNFSSSSSSLVAQSCLTLCEPCEPQHARPPCPSPTLRVHPNPGPLSRWCHPTISFSVIPFSSRLQSFPASGSFPMSQLFTSGGQSIRVSASTSVLPMNTQDWSPLGWTGWISLQSKGLSNFSGPLYLKWVSKE